MKAIITIEKENGIKSNISFYDDAGLPISLSIIKKYIEKEKIKKIYEKTGELVTKAHFLISEPNTIDTERIFGEKEIRL